jgi:hypothetical protein
VVKTEQARLPEQRVGIPLLPERLWQRVILLQDVPDRCQGDAGAVREEQVTYRPVEIEQDTIDGRDNSGRQNPVGSRDSGARRSCHPVSVRGQVTSDQ